MKIRLDKDRIFWNYWKLTEVSGIILEGDGTFLHEKVYIELNHHFKGRTGILLLWETSLFYTGSPLLSGSPCSAQELHWRTDTPLLWDSPHKLRETQLSHQLSIPLLSPPFPFPHYSTPIPTTCLPLRTDWLSDSLSNYIPYSASYLSELSSKYWTSSVHLSDVGALGIR
jgi:hypothetical protein